MKQAIAVLILLAILAALIVWNALYINKVANDMTALLDALPDVDDPACPKAAAALREAWMRRLPVVDLTVSFLYTDRICEQSALLICCAETGDRYGFASAKALLADAFHDMCHAETLNSAALF